MEIARTIERARSGQGGVNRVHIRLALLMSVDATILMRTARDFWYLRCKGGDAPARSRERRLRIDKMGRIPGSATDRNAFCAVAIILGPERNRALGGTLSAFVADQTAVVAWRADGAAVDELDLGAFARSRPFVVARLRDGLELMPGIAYLAPARCSVWFEGARVRLGPRLADASCSTDRLLTTLGTSWGPRGVALLACELPKGAEGGAAALEAAGGLSVYPLGDTPLTDNVAINQTGTFPSLARRMREQEAGTGAPSLGSRASVRRPDLFPFPPELLNTARRACEAAVQRSVERGRLRVWLPACETGAVAYSLAMLLDEAAHRVPARPKLQLFGTDENEGALAIARVGRYPLQAAVGVDPELRRLYTLEEGATVRVVEALREACLFSRHRLIQDPPLSRMDLLICHGVFEGVLPDRREEVIDAFHEALRQGGLVLALGHAEHFTEQRFERLGEGCFRARLTRAKSLPPRALPTPSATPRGSAVGESSAEHGSSEPVRARSTSRELGPDHALEEVMRVHGELESFVSAIGVPLVFCDQELRVLQMSAEASLAFSLSDRDRGAPLRTLIDRLPGSAELLEAAERAVRAGATQELTIRSSQRVYIARISAAKRAEALGVVIVFTDVTALEVAKAQAVAQRHQQAAVARIGDLALSRASQAEVFEEALSVLFGNIPICCCGIILERVGAGPELAVVASRGFGPDPLETLRSMGEPSQLLDAALAQERPVVHTAVAGDAAEPDAASEAGASAEPRSSSGATGVGVERGAVHWRLPFVTGGLACPILNEGAMLGTIALYARQSGIEAAEHQHFVQAVANVLGGAIARHRTRRRLALELEVTTILARAHDLSSMGRGITEAFVIALGAEEVEIWEEAAPPRWSCLFPAQNGAEGTPPWPEGVLHTSRPSYRSASSGRPQHEIWVPIMGRKAVAAVLGIRGRELRSPDDELSVGLERIGGMLADFLDRLRILDALTRSEASYRQSSAEFEALFATLPVGVSIHGREGEIRRLNRHLAQLETAGDNSAGAPLLRLYSEEAPRWIRRVLESGEPIHDLELCLSEGADVQSWLCNFAAIRDSDGTILGASAVVQDITPLKRVETSLREADRQKDDFLAMLGHELRNPMAAIRNATELLSRIEHPSPQLLRLQSIFDRQTVQTTKLIDGLLDIARVVRGKVELQVAPIELCDLIRQILDDRRHQVRQRCIDVSLPEHDVWVTADRVRLTQILDNLLSNAIKFTTPEGRISVQLCEDGERGWLRVHDDGMGIEPELLPRIFEPFRQGRAMLPQSQAGLGLGLALVKGLIDLHGFELRVESDGVGRGTAVTIEFATTGVPEPAAPASAIDTRELRLLMVEDNLDIAETLAELLRGTGHVVEMVGSAEEALDSLAKQRPDIVLCDIGLPGMDGLTLAARVREDPSLCNLKLVAMTGYGDASTRTRINSAGFDRHLIKPVQLEALRHCLARLAAAPENWCDRR